MRQTLDVDFKMVMKPMQEFLQIPIKHKETKTID